MDTVDVVLGSVAIDEKFLGFTLFALVPNTTEFLNAISFALNGNIALRLIPSELELIAVWKSAQLTHYKYVYYRSLHSWRSVHF